jgi:hypothetical protein
LGNGSALFHNYLYLWNGTYFIKLEPREGEVSPEEVTFVGRSIINLMPYKKVSLPAIMGYLPDQYLIQESIKFFHKKIILDNIYISDNPIEENVFHLSEKTDAVIAEYKHNASTEPSKLMLILYPDIDTARRALDDVIKLWRSWGEREFTDGMIHTFQDNALRYTSCLLKTNILGMTFFFTNKEDAETLLKLIAEKL